MHLSSPSIYFDGRDHLDLNEEYVPRRFSDHYGATKYQAEQLVLSARDLGLEVLALRPRFVVGAGDTSIFPRMIQAHRKGRLRILGNGLNRVDFTSVHNLNDALFSCLLAGEPALGKVYNISNGQPVPFWDAVNYVMRQARPAAGRRSPAVCRRLWPGGAQRRRLPDPAGAPGAGAVPPGHGGDGEELHPGHQPRPRIPRLRPAGQPVDRA